MLALKAKQISKRFKRKGETIWALRNVSIDVRKGEVFCLLGPNGAGKTTLINIFLSLLIPDEGGVRILGKDPFIEKEVLQHVNFVPLERAESHLKVEEFLLCYAKLYDVDLDRVKLLLKELKLEKFKRYTCWTLSTGEKSRVSLAKALLNAPAILFLDEPMFGLDPKARNEIREILKGLNREGTTIFFASHDMMEVQRLASRIAFIKDGKILEVEEKGRIVKQFGNVERYWLRLGK